MDTLKINSNIIIVVAEPWNFVSSEGDNRFAGTIINFTETTYGDTYLIKVNSPFIFNGQKIGYVVAVYRNRAINLKGLNISIIPDDIVEKFNDFNSIKDYLKFIIIGSFKD